MKKIVDNSKCCGCHACFNICPKGAIKMIEDDKGFKYPIIDEKKCINCGLCEKVCPILNAKKNEYEKKVYAIINKNESERINSSSGGIFILLAKTIINKGGIVFGAAFDDDFKVKHICIDTIDDIYKLQGSKYVQSEIKDTYKKVKKFLEQDKYVLFTGTSCQIEGLKTYLIKDYDKLYTQDIICHGVPSPKVWQKYLEYQKENNNENIRSISFRNKDNGWSLFRTKILFDNKIYSKSLSDDIFMKAFLRNTCLRSSCYNCSFKNDYRNSDITLADFWGVKSAHPNLFDDKGTSVVIINSKKGEELFNHIKSYCIYEESKMDYIYKFNPAYLKSAIKDKKYDQFFQNIDNMQFDILVKKCVSQDSLFSKCKNRIKRVIKKCIRRK